MLKIHSKSMDFNGASIVDEVIIASMHASYAGGKEMYMNMSISDVEAYAANKAVVDADLIAFSDAVITVINAQVEEPEIEPEVQE